MSSPNSTLTPPQQQTNYNWSTGGGPLAPAPNDPQPPQAPQKGERRLRLDTLGGQFNTLVFVVVAVALATLLVNFLMLSNTNERFRQIVNESAPSITAALQLGAELQDTDAKAADYQLSSRIDVSSPDFDPKVYGPAGLRNSAWQTYLTHRRSVNDLIFAARNNISYPGEADAVNVISQRFMDYTAQINIMKYELDQGHREAALAAYKSAHDILIGNLGNVALDDKGRSPEEQLKLNNWQNFDPSKQYLGLEANVQKLYEINKRQLDTAARDAQGAVDRNIFAAIVTAIVLIGALVLLSVRYAIVTHRLINPGYVVALIAAIAICLPLINSFTQAKADYKRVVSDTFVSIEAVYQIRQTASDGNADESRLLLNPQSAGLDSTSPFLTADVKKAFTTATLQENFDKKRDLVNNDLKTAWSNVTFSGETTALCSITADPRSASRCGSNPTYNWNKYLDVDKDLRDRFNRNLLAEAIKINVGLSNQTYDSFDKGVQQLLDVNTREFDTATCNAIGAAPFSNNCKSTGYVPTLQLAIWVVFPLIALATVGGYVFARREF